MNTTALILPGIGNSGPDHWQSLWEAADSSFVRVQQRDWDNPVCAEWLAELDQSVAKCSESVVLVAHSLACLLLAHWAANTSLKIKGALLVAPPDPSGLKFPKAAKGFAPFPLQPFPFPGIVVASTDDPYGSMAFAQTCAFAWGCRFANAGAVGHIGSASGVGSWPEGYALYSKLAE